jgi:hypothetical protein
MGPLLPWRARRRVDSPSGLWGVGAEVGASLCDPATASPMLSGSDHGKRLGQDNPILCGI